MKKLKAYSVNVEAYDGLLAIPFDAVSDADAVALAARILRTRIDELPLDAPVAIVGSHAKPIRTKLTVSQIIRRSGSLR